jgi:hypothetical protein
MKINWYSKLDIASCDRIEYTSILSVNNMFQASQENGISSLLKIIYKVRRIPDHQNYYSIIL